MNSELLLGRIPHSQLELVGPSLMRKVQAKQHTQKEHHDAHAEERRFTLDDLVYVQVQDLPRGSQEVSVQSVDHCLIIQDGQTLCCHIYYIQGCTSASILEDSAENVQLQLYGVCNNNYSWCSESKLNAYSRSTTSSTAKTTVFVYYITTEVPESTVLTTTSVGSLLRGNCSKLWIYVVL